MLIITLITLPFLTAIGTFVFSVRRKWIEMLAIGSGTLELVFAALIVFGGKGAVAGNMLAQYLSPDGLGSWFLLVVASLGFIGLCYSVSFLRTEEERGEIGYGRVKQYYALYQLFLLSMFVAALAQNMILLWIAVEATTLSTAFLISFYGKSTSIEAAWKYIIINSLALVIGLLGVFLFVGALKYPELLPVIKIAFVLVLLGFGTKAGLAPMHTWLPDAHSEAPAPVSALLSGALLNIALLGILRFKEVIDTVIGPSFSSTTLFFFGTTSIVVASVLILVQKQYKRLLAYSSIEHIGIITFGFALGGIGSVAALLHALYHSLAKSMLFLASGNIVLRYHTLEIAHVRGLLRTLPVTGTVFLGGLLAVAGVPPFGTFLTEFVIFTTAFTVHPVLTIIALFALALAFVGIVRHLSTMLFGAAETDIVPESAGSVIPLLVTFALLIVLGLYTPHLLNLLVQEAVFSL